MHLRRFLAVGVAAVGASTLAFRQHESALAYSNKPTMSGGSGPAMVKIPAIIAKGMSVNGEAPNLPKLADNESEKNSQTWLADLGSSTVAGKEMTCGLFRMNKGKALHYTYDYEELKFIVEGEFVLTDGTGQRVIAKAGDLVYFPQGSRIVFETPDTALGYFCGQRKTWDEHAETPNPDQAKFVAMNPAMVHYPSITSAALKKMVANESERRSQTWLGDFGITERVSSKDPSKQMVSGLFRMNKGRPLEYEYTYEELKLIIGGTFHLRDGTGQSVVAEAGDLMYFPKGSKIVFDTPDTALGYFCGQREPDPAVAMY